MEFKTYRFDEVSISFDKKRVPLSSMQREKRRGTYRYYGAQGVIDYIDDYIFDGTYMLIAEDGENLKSKKQSIRSPSAMRNLISEKNGCIGICYSASPILCWQSTNWPLMA